MQTERIHVPSAPAESDPGIVCAATILRRGGLVAFPTETVYGLGARADDAAAVARIFAAKGRPAQNPLIVHVADREAARGASIAWSDAAEALARAFWPGPLTLVVRRDARRFPDEVTAGGDTVALRVPAHPVARALLVACGLPIAAPSANRSTTISPTTADHVMKSLAGRIDLCLDAGPTGLGIESTIIDVSGPRAVLLRRGAIAASAIAAHVELVDRGGEVVDPGERAAAPGRQARHYAPSASLSLIAASAMRAAVAAKQAHGEAVGALLREHDRDPAIVDLAAAAEILPDDAPSYAAGLYAALHRLDDAGCTSILAAHVPEDPAWDAVRDRLQRAAAPRS